MPTVSPLWNNSYVFKSSRGKLSGFKSLLYLFLTRFTVSRITDKVFKPRKSIFNKPALSTTELSNWVTYKSLSLAVEIGTNWVISSGVIITPHAWVPTFLREPSKTFAWLIVCPVSEFSFAIFFISLILTISSVLKLSLSSLSVSEKIWLNFILGTSLAILSASGRGKSRTRAVSLIDDLAAIVP